MFYDGVQRDACETLAEVVRLRGRTAQQGRAIFHRWSTRIDRPVFRVGALNLAHYLASDASTRLSARPRDERPSAIKRRCNGRRS
jgi:hypothetical protein